ncbi:putative ribonuclease H-like domain-containing protein [Tanacetum coccineum]
MGYFQLIRANGSLKRYSSMIKMLQNIDREDMETLWKLVKAKHGNTRSEKAYERVLWGDLKVMFEPDIESKVWRNLQGYNVTVWKLFSSSGVHFVRFQNLHIFMLVEKKYPLIPATITKMLNKKLQTDHWNEMCYQLLKLMTKLGRIVGIKSLYDDLGVNTAKGTCPISRTLRNLMEDMLPLEEEPNEGKLLMCGQKEPCSFHHTGCFCVPVHLTLKVKLMKSQVLLKVHRKNNMYSVDIKNIVPKESLTCLVAKTTLDESMLSHRKLGHVNFKAINKHVKENLVRGLPSKCFENDQRARVLLVLRESNAKPLDETSGILKSFITEIENLVDKKVKIIRCDNGTEFINRVMSNFCKKKGIKREFSVARTPQQNGVAERRNRTLIEAARTILRLDLLTILNTLDYLGKFDGKSDEGFFIGYSLNSKDFRVYNTRTRKVKENLHIRFLEDKTIIAGDGPKWLFDIDVLTKLMNYVPIVAGTNSNDSVRDQAKLHIDAKMERWITYLNSIFKRITSNDEPQPSSDARKKDDEGTRRIIKTTNEQGFISAIYEGKTHEDIHTCLFACFLSQEEPKKVWTLVDLPHGKRAIGTKWVYRNKKDKRGIVIRNKARLVAQGYTQEEGIDYDEVFALVARIEAIRLFLAYASFKDFVVYQMDVKSAFLYGKIEEEVYVCQPPGFEDPKFPDRVYKVEKALYGLHQAPRAWYETLSTYLLDNGFQKRSTKKNICAEFDMHKKFQMSSMGELTFFLGLQVTQKDDGIFISQDKYVDEILKKFGFSTLKIASTPMETSKPLLKDAKAKDVDVHLYRLMIGSLMYSASLRPDIMFVVCACARFQVTPKVSHLHAVKRIFRYLKGQPKLGRWYPKDSPFYLEAYSDSDYASASLDRKSTTKGCQFLRSRLISWQCKKQTIVSNFTTEAEYVVAASCCGQLRIQCFTQRLSTLRLEHHFIRDSNEKKLIQMIKIHTDQNVIDLLTKAFDDGRFQYLIASIGMLNL